MFFLLFIVIFNNFSIILVAKEDIKLILALTNPTGAPITLVKEMMHIHSLVANKTLQVFSK